MTDQHQILMTLVLLHNSFEPDKIKSRYLLPVEESFLGDDNS